MQQQKLQNCLPSLALPGMQSLELLAAAQAMSMLLTLVTLLLLLVVVVVVTHLIQQVLLTYQVFLHL